MLLADDVGNFNFFAAVCLGRYDAEGSVDSGSDPKGQCQYLGGCLVRFRSYFLINLLGKTSSVVAVHPLWETDKPN